MRLSYIYTRDVFSTYLFGWNTVYRPSKYVSIWDKYLRLGWIEPCGSLQSPKSYSDNIILEVRRMPPVMDMQYVHGRDSRVGGGLEKMNIFLNVA